MMLATWLVEFYLSKCNELDDIVASESVSHDVDNLQTERAILEDELRQFFDTYKHNLDRDTTYELIQGHGRTDMYLYYATTIGDFGRVVDHWILEERWPKALDVINRQVGSTLTCSLMVSHINSSGESRAVLPLCTDPHSSGT